ncbi:MAG: efflux RND transporter periplasmic adaptor subunit [Ignavibacteria bacterium]|jgi:membrane fusion protein (multidrug efflux system)
MNTRLTIIIASVILITASSCSKQGDGNIDVQLQELRNQRSEIEAKIKDLEARASKTGASNSDLPVSVATVNESPLEHIIDVKGAIESKSTVMLSSQMPGRITGVFVSSGQTVRAGQLLVEIDNEAIKRGLDELRVQLDFAKTLYEKQKRVYEQKAGSEIQYLTAKNQLDALERRMESLKEQLAMSRITAPRAGVCDNVTAKVGEMAAPGMPLMMLVNLSDVRVVVDVSEAFVSTVSRGDKATITFGETSDTVRTVIKAVSGVVNPMNRTFRLELPLTKLPSAVRPNSTCRVAINDVTIDKSITVPLSCVQRDADGSYVYVVDESNVVKRRTVVTGMTSGGSVQIVNGLQVNERVVVKGMTTIADGQTVKVVS